MKYKLLIIRSAPGEDEGKTSPHFHFDFLNTQKKKVALTYL